MTETQTRQLGIEFERRVQTMIPERELNKLDTDTIYSYLNQYQDKYIHEIYRSLDQIPSGTKLSAHIESILQSLLSSFEINRSQENTWVFGDSFPIELQQSGAVIDLNGVNLIDTARSITFVLPEDFYMYVRSVSKVDKTFSFRGAHDNEKNIRILPNQLVSQNEVWKLIETPHNTLRILRYPAAVLNVKQQDKPVISIIHDQYTNITGIKVIYYKQPRHFSILTGVTCELPMDAFDDIVSGAVDLYVQYVAGAEARKREMQQQAQKRAREDQRDARRSGGNQDEQS